MNPSWVGPLYLGQNSGVEKGRPEFKKTRREIWQLSARWDRFELAGHEEESRCDRLWCAFVVVCVNDDVRTVI